MVGPVDFMRATFRPIWLLAALLQLGGLAISLHPAPARPAAAGQLAKDGPTTVDYYLKQVMSRKATETCLPELESDGFANPINALSEQMDPSGKLFLIGDSVIGHLCQLGSPGLCCSNTRPCEGAQSYNSEASPWEIKLDEQVPYRTQGWQHLIQFKARSINNTAINPVYFVAPEVHDDPDLVEQSVQLVVGFLQEQGTSDKDVIVMGMIGNHYNHGLDAFDKFAGKMIRSVINRFPGRAVLLSYSPQHFPGAGHFTGKTNQACTPSPLPGSIDPPKNSFRNAIFLVNVWRELANKRARLVNLFETLNPLWACHRVVGDCTHWKDPVISMQVQLFLNALEKLP